MKALNRFRPFKVLGFICIAMFAAGCVDGQPIGGPGGPDTGGLSAETTLTSTSLTGGEPTAAQLGPDLPPSMVPLPMLVEHAPDSRSAAGGAKPRVA